MLPQKAQAQRGVSISFQTFYQELSPYGQWTTSPQYGSVWTPYHSGDFQPYSTNGYWEMTEYGNTWVSNYEWGWAPFHYGRWSFDDYLGWFWIPGYEWGPAWVNWRSGGGYYGWAPLGPGVNINIAVNIPSFWWILVPNRHFYTSNWHRYWVPRNRISRIYNQTTIINNYYRRDNRTYVYGPRRDEIERYTRRSVPVRQVVVNDRGRIIVNQSSRNSQPYSPPANSRGSVYDTRSGNERSSRTGSSDRSGYTPPRESTTSSRTGVVERSSSPSYNSRSSRTEAPRESGNTSRSYEPPRSRTTSPSTSPSRSERSSSPAPSRSSSRERSSTPTVRSSPSVASPSRSTRTSSPARSSTTRSESSRESSSSERSSRSPR